MKPEQFPRRVLLAVTGMSPQVVTETLYALVVDQGFVPTEIRLITTQLGRNRVENDLLDPQRGHFHAFCREYDLVGKIQFDASCITVIQDGAGKALPDIRTPDENKLAADEIARVVQSLCQDEMAALHVSIAGGRKSMGFFLGYALSLFARPQDRLSHVLVSEPFENHREFFYPARTTSMLVRADGQKVDSSQAKVMLADIPVVRLRAGLPDALLQGETSYSVAVHAAQAGISPEISLEFDIPERTVICGGVRVKLAPILFAMMLWLAELRLSFNYLDPNHEGSARAFLDVYRRVVGDSADYDNAQEYFLHKDADVLKRFQEFNSRIKDKLKGRLGDLARAYYMERIGRGRELRYQLVIDPQFIKL
jgi:CRISPR-associated protein (TIGR02584 family)